MTSLSRFTFALLPAVLLAFSACGGDEPQQNPQDPQNPLGQGQGQGSGTTEQPATAEGLQSLMQSIRKAALAQQSAEAARLVRGLQVDAASLAKALREDSGEASQRILTGLQELWPQTDEQLAQIFGGQPERTEVRVHGASGEQLAAEGEGSAAVGEFPGGAREAAKKVLRPDVTYYEVEFLEPGKDTGLKFHLFFHDGTQWKMLSKVWRWIE